MHADHTPIIFDAPGPRTGHTPTRAGGLNSLELLAGAWLAGFHVETTFKGYRTDLRQWFSWCEARGVHPLEVHRAVISTYQTELLTGGLAERTAARKMSAIASFYRYCEEEGAVERTPMAGVKRIVVERISPRSALSSGQANDLAWAAREDGPDAFALVMILLTNGTRIGETCALDVDDLVIVNTSVGAFPALQLQRRKGGKTGQAILDRTTEAAVRAAVDGRTTGPLLRIKRNGNRMNQKAAQVILDHAARKVRGTPPRITPHVLRHTWCSLALANGVPSSQVQHDGGWTDERLVTYYGHGHENPVRAASHSVSAAILAA